MKPVTFFALLLVGALYINASCSKSTTTTPNPPTPPTITGPAVESWITTASQSMLLSKQTEALSFSSSNSGLPTIEVDSTQIFQTIDGFGYTLTSGSASLINALPANQKTTLLQELFGHSAANAIGISYLRMSIGASDLSDSVYSYNDMPTGQTDENLLHFSLKPDQSNMIPLLKEIIGINPGIKILATPWSAPVWMKDNNSSIGGHLLPKYQAVYARYFVKFIQQMKTEGIDIDAITPQNEPLNPNNNPSLEMLADQQLDFIKNDLGPQLQAAGLTTKIICYDHNCDRPEYAATILGNAAASAFVNGSAFHLYAGDIGVLSQVHNAHPDKAVYFTEQYTASNGQFGGDLKWHVKNVIIGSMRNWSRTALEWNLASNASYEPHTPGGCNTCKGALTIDGGNVYKNVGYYIIAHASKFVPAGSVRIASNVAGGISTVAFLRPDGKKVLIAQNDGAAISFYLKYNGLWALATLPEGAVATYVW